MKALVGFMGGSHATLSWEVLLGGSPGRLSRTPPQEALMKSSHGRLSWEVSMGGSHGRFPWEAEALKEAPLASCHRRLEDTRVEK